MNTQSKGLVLEGDLSLSLKPISEYPGADKLMLADHENEKFLKTSAIWHEPVELEELDHIGLELRRQDLKISLLMEMVSELLLKQSHLPRQHPTKLTASSLECLGGDPDLSCGDKVEIILYIAPAFPKALRLYGEVTESDKQGAVSIRFHGMSPAVQDRIEKLIFTQHRRSIAQGLSH